MIKYTCERPTNDRTVMVGRTATHYWKCDTLTLVIFSISNNTASKTNPTRMTNIHTKTYSQGLSSALQKPFIMPYLGVKNYTCKGQSFTYL